MSKDDLSEQDGEFLEDIEPLSESQRNGVIAYMKDKIDTAVFWEQSRIVCLIDELDIKGMIALLENLKEYTIPENAQEGDHPFGTVDYMVMDDYIKALQSLRAKVTDDKASGALLVSGVKPDSAKKKKKGDEK